MYIQQDLLSHLHQAFLSLYQQAPELSELKLQPTRKEFEGSYTFVTFPYARLSKKGPEQTGQELGQYLKEHSELVRDFNVVKGFLNLVIADGAWLSTFQTLATDASWGQLPARGSKVVVEYSSPNTNKPLHLGHLRNNFLGYSVSQILKACGYEVSMVNLVNDRGIHICKSMLAYEKFGKGETPQSSGIKGDHLVGKYYVEFDRHYRQQIEELVGQGMDKEEAKTKAPLLLQAQEMLRQWEAGKPEVVNLWETMNSWVYKGFEETYTKIGVQFDKYYRESETYLLGKDIVEEGLEKGIFFKKEGGSVWIDLTADGLDEKLVLRGDGTSVYITQDMGTADLKYKDFGMEKSLVVVGNEQDYHFKVLFLILEKLGRPYAPGNYHLSYGMVDLPSGKMKSREGTVVDADDLVREMEETAERYTRELGKVDGMSPEEAGKLFEMLGLGALKYYLLRVDPKKRMLFDPQESIDFQGNTGPFIQYTHARIASLLRRAADMGIGFQDVDVSALTDLHPSEREVIYQLSLYPEQIRTAGEAYAPSFIAQYVYDLAKEFNRFYTEVSVFNAEDSQRRDFRIALSSAVGRTLRHGMSLLGIEVPERM
ncbi:arginine--tRNA ligase [Cesiribacter andamanensis]|uniref:Arginine--tRNA ligase n=1 Tax=Cesiribacter andamanensis AMV16 TaxID=1279009 RepID=M7NC65_9BACT|nr:arginine--tRNA ligase [Cesiribacter andamanensis]EMR04832.1 Arginine--tRNA ligase [Cesiribacter andamanensis AMV16]